MQLFKPSVKWLARQQCVLYLFLCVENVYILMKPVRATDTFQEVQQHFAKNQSFFKFTFKLKAYFFSFIKKTSSQDPGPVIQSQRTSVHKQPNVQLL